MSLTCSDHSVYCGDPGNPPELVSDNEEECGACGTFIDLDDEPHTVMVDDTIRCEACRELCAGCGEFIADYGKSLLLRDPVTGRKEWWCIECGAADWMERLLYFMADAMEKFDPLSSITVRSVHAGTISRWRIDSVWAFYWRQQ